jgi:uncharacterized membrane protein
VSDNQHHRGVFGDDPFGRRAERGARLFGTPQYIVGQTIVVIAWIAVNAVAVSLRWDPYPFILLNLAFSTQAAYAAPLILLAQTRQADRDKLHADAMESHRERLAEDAERRERELKEAVALLRELLERNTELTNQDRELTNRVHELTREIHTAVVRVQPS